MIPFRLPLRRVRVALLCGLLVAIAAPALATDRAAELRERAARTRALLEQDSEKRAEWQQEYRELLAAFRDAREAETAATIERRKKRKKNRLRGDARVAADQKIVDASEAETAAVEELAAFYERARAKSVDPAWLRDVEEEFPSLVDDLPEAD